MGSPRPAAVDAGRYTSDDGLFGPESVTWRVIAHPATGLSATSAATLQMLYPPVMYVIDQASGVRDDPDRRAQRTGEYMTTIVYGDVAAAEAAGAALRRVHASRQATDPETGRTVHADEPDLLEWVHNALTWILLRGYATYGESLTAAERDRFVDEQRVAARLVGCDPERIPADTATLDAYMQSMEPRLAFTEPALWFREMVAPGGLPTSPHEVLGRLTTAAAMGLMGPTHRRLYGFRSNAIADRATELAMRTLIQATTKSTPLEAAIPQLREFVDTHAFGARRRRIVDVEPAPGDGDRGADPG